MNQTTPAPDPADDLRQVLTQLCNRTNLRIIHILYRENITMNFVLCRKLGISSQLVSKRLKALVVAGLVTREQIFKRRYYRLNREQFAELGVSLDLLLKDLHQ